MLKKILAVAFVVFCLSATGCMGARVEVPPAHYGKVVTSSGYQKGLISEPKTFRLPYEFYNNTRLVLVEGSDVGVSETMDVFMPKDKLGLKFDVRGTFAITSDEEKIEHIFQRVRPKPQDGNTNVLYVDFDDVYTIYGAPKLRTVARQVVTKYSTEELLVNMKAVSAELEKEVRESLKDTPIVVLNLDFANIQPPQVVIIAQEARKKREVEIDQADADKLVKLKEAEAAFAVAQKQQEVDLLEAETQVKVEGKLSESVTPAFVQQRMLKILDKAAEKGSLLIISEEVLRNPAALLGIHQEIGREMQRMKEDKK